MAKSLLKPLGLLTIILGTPFSKIEMVVRIPNTSCWRSARISTQCLLTVRELPVALFATCSMEVAIVAHTDNEY